MFYYLEGVVTVIENGIAVIDVGGIGFRCNTTLNTISYLEIGKKAKLYTYCNVKEDAFDIYGFYDTAEKRCFEMLLSVSGVGPKAAISILSSTNPENFAMSIISENEKALTSAPGIGKRTAQRIILELKDKLSKESGTFSGSGSKSALPFNVGVPSGGKLNDVTAALSVLGYSQAEITAAIKSVDMDVLSVEEIIKQVLRNSIK